MERTARRRTCVLRWSLGCRRSAHATCCRGLARERLWPVTLDTRRASPHKWRRALRAQVAVRPSLPPLALDALPAALAPHASLAALLPLPDWERLCRGACRAAGFRRVPGRRMMRFKPAVCLTGWPCSFLPVCGGRDCAVDQCMWRERGPLAPCPASDAQLGCAQVRGVARRGRAARPAGGVP